MTATPPNSDAAADRDSAQAPEVRDIGEVPAVEIVTTVALHLMSAAAVKVGLADGSGDPSAGSEAADLDLDEARTLILALAGMVTACAPRLGTFHAAPLRDGLRTLQLAFREASVVPDAPGTGPGEDLTGAVYR